MLNFISFKLTAAVLACFLVSAFVALRLGSPAETQTIMLVSAALGYVGVLALKSLATALIVRVLSGKSVSLPSALTISLATYFVHQVSSDLYLALS